MLTDLPLAYPLANILINLGGYVSEATMTDASGRDKRPDIYWIVAR
jgi:hypothetical protein